MIKPHESIILLESVFHQVGLHCTHKIVIEKAIDGKVEDFLNTVPNSIGADPSDVCKNFVI